MRKEGFQVAENRVFEYRLDDAWGMPRFRLRVLDQKKDNVVCIDMNCDRRTPKSEHEQLLYSIPYSDVQKIASVVADDTLLAGIDKCNPVESGIMVMDGFMNTFYFSCQGGLHRIDADNIACMVDSPSENSSRILKAFDAISDILIANGIDGKYLSLN